MEDKYNMAQINCFPLKQLIAILASYFVVVSLQRYLVIDTTACRISDKLQLLRLYQWSGRC